MPAQLTPADPTLRLPHGWTPIATREPFGWRYAPGWDARTVERLRESGALVTALRGAEMLGKMVVGK